MSTVVTKLGTVAANLDGSGTVNWNNLTNALTNNSQYAVAAFTSGSTISEFLYVSAFAFALPSTAVIEGIQATVKRKAVGPVTDNYVGLIYTNAGSPTITSPDKGSATTWSAVNEVVLYGGAADLWNSTWNTTLINDSAFGLAISADGDGSLNNQASIDYVQLSISYHQVINHTPTGGGSCAGSATVSYKISQTPSGGARLAGHGSTNFNIIASGGGYLAGDASAEHGVIPTGGAYAAGTATANTVYDTNLGTNVYEFYCTGPRNVPAESNTKIAVVRVTVDAVANRVYWQILHNLTEATTVRFAGPADEDETGATILSLHSLGSTVSPIRGNAAITPTEVGYFQNKQVYLRLRDDPNDQTIRGQVTNYPSRLSGTAPFNRSYNVTPTSGGLAASSATVQERLNPVISGGVYGAGASISYVDQDIKGGVHLAGPTVLTTTLTPPITSAGVIAASSATALAKYTVSPSLDGPLAGGQALRSLNVPIGSGVAYVAGASTWLKLNIPIVSGGAYLGGTHVLQQTYAAQDIRGGLKIYGSWIGEKIKFYTSDPHRNYALAMKSENILNVVVPRQEKLRDPNSSLVPALSEDRFRIRHNAGWCEFGDQCKDAFLPAIIKNRQKGVLPPKSGV